MNAKRIAVSAAGISLSAFSAAAADKPNILFIFTDDHALNAITAYSDFFKAAGFETPNIDRLADEGAVLLNNTCCNSISGPSRAAVLTGKHSHANGFRDNSTRFNPRQFTFVRELQKNGYQTALIGKWHLGDDLNPSEAGFDHWNVLINQGTYYNPEFRTPEGRRTVKGYSTDIITDLSIEQMENALGDGRPFLMMCQYKAPHRDWQPAMRHLDLYEGVEWPLPATFFYDFDSAPRYMQETRMRVDGHMFPGWDMKLRATEIPRNFHNLYGRNMANTEPLRLSAADRKKYYESYKEENRLFKQANHAGRERAVWKYQRYIRDYLRVVKAVDENVGRLLDWLDEKGIAGDTLIVYSSDQGFFLGEKGMFDKRWMYAPSLSMPFLARWPGVIPAGTKVTALTQNIDFAPTFLEAAAVPVPADAGVQGESFLPLLKGENPAGWRKSIYYHFYESRAVEPEHWCPAQYGIFDGRYKLIRLYEPYADAWELYDLQNDPDEMRNLWNEDGYGGLKTEMLRRLTEIKAFYGDPVESGKFRVQKNGFKRSRSGR